MDFCTWPLAKLKFTTMAMLLEAETQTHGSDSYSMLQKYTTKTDSVSQDNLISNWNKPVH